MNRSNATLVVGLAGLIAGAAVVYFAKPLAWCEPSHVNYVVEWNNVKFRNSNPDPNPADVAAFTTALGNSFVAFRHNIVISHTAGVNDAPELKNIRLGSLCFSKPEPAVGLHVTQRVGFSNYAQMQEAEKYLQH